MLVYDKFKPRENLSFHHWLSGNLPVLDYAVQSLFVLFMGLQFYRRNCAVKFGHSPLLYNHYEATQNIQGPKDAHL